MNRLWAIITSLKLTVILLGFSMALIFLGTLDQVEFGIYEVQKRYFESFFTFWTYPMQWPGGKFLHWFVLPLIGGYLLAILLVINLLAAHFKYFVAKWNKLGIMMIHGGVLLLIISGVAISLFQEESQMLLNPDQPTYYSQVMRENELVLIGKSDSNKEQDHAIDEKRLLSKQWISVPGTPLSIKLEKFYPNAFLGLRSQHPDAQEKSFATQGAGIKMDIVVFPRPITYKYDEINAATAYVSVKAADEDIGTWLVSRTINENFPPQKLIYEDKTYEIALRAKRIELPFALKLIKFSHDVYPGTDIARNFSSLVEIVDSTKAVDRSVLIYMNHPLRYQGYTLYQASYQEETGRPILQVVKNPSWLLPYFSVLLIGLGLTVHFFLHLLTYLKRKSEP